MTTDPDDGVKIIRTVPRRHIFSGRLVYAQPCFELQLMNGATIHIKYHKGFEIYCGHIVKVEVIQLHARYYSVERIRALNRQHSMDIWWRMFEKKFNKRPRDESL